MTPKRSRFDYAKEQTAETEVQQQTEELEKIEVLALPASLAVASGVAALQNPATFALPPQRKGRRANDEGIKRTDVPREQLNVRVRPELKRAAAGLAGLQGMTLGDVVEAALIAYIHQSRKSE